jgi:hypothetical protein
MPPNQPEPTYSGKGHPITHPNLQIMPDSNSSSGASHDLSIGPFSINTLNPTRRPCLLSRRPPAEADQIHHYPVLADQFVNTNTNFKVFKARAHTQHLTPHGSTLFPSGKLLHSINLSTESLFLAPDRHLSPAIRSDGGYPGFTCRQRDPPPSRR